MTETEAAPAVNMHCIRLDEHGSVKQLCNPITRAWVDLVPYFTLNPFDGMDQLAKLQLDFYHFCDEAWTGPRKRNPTQVNPYAILAGTEQVHPLDDVLYRLAREYGFWSVAEALKKHEPGGGV